MTPAGTDSAFRYHILRLLVARQYLNSFWLPARGYGSKTPIDSLATY